MRLEDRKMRVKIGQHGQVVLCDADDNGSVRGWRGHWHGHGHGDGNDDQFDNRRREDGGQKSDNGSRIR